MAMYPHDALNGQYPALQSQYIAANAVGQSELSGSAIGALYKSAKEITLSTGRAAAVQCTGYAPSMILGLPKTVAVSGSKLLQPLTISTIAGSKFSCRANTITPTGAMVAAATACFFIIAW